MDTHFARPAPAARHLQALAFRLLLLWLTAASGRGVAQEGTLPPFKNLRWEEDYAFLRTDTATRRAGGLNRLKFIPLARPDRQYLSVGGEVRYQYDFMRNPNWGEGPQDRNGYLLQRYMLHADWHAGRHLRVFGQLKSGIESNKRGGPEPPDEDHLDVHQAFVDWRLTPFTAGEVTLRAGRQELSYGSSRLVSVREGPNVRQSFDAGKIVVRGTGWQGDAFVSRPVETNPGVFDDRSNPNAWFWGVYGQKALPALLRGNLDVYYFGLDDRDAAFAQGAQRERRHAAGLRYWSNGTPLRYNLEAVYQLGRFGRGNIRAWTASAELAYGLDGWPLAPELNLKAEIISGDRRPENPDLNTFNPLFPKGAYFGQVALIGPANLVDVHPTLTLKPGPGLELITDWDFFWRESAADGLYGVPYVLIRERSGSRALYIGDQLSFELDWQAHRHLQLEGFFTFFRAGALLRESGAGKDLLFLSSRVTFKF